MKRAGDLKRSDETGRSAEDGAADLLAAPSSLIPIPSRRRGERRSALRRYLSVQAAFTINESVVGEGLLRDISETGLRILTDAPVERGAIAQCRPGKLGVFKGVVVRTFPSGFAIRYRLFPDEIDALNQAVSDHFRSMPHAARGTDRRLVPDRREEARFYGDIAKLWGFDAGGREFEAEVVNVSVSGVLIRTAHPLSIGERVALSTRPGYVVRASEGGYAIKWA